MSNRINKIKISLLVVTLIAMLGLTACGNNDETVAAAAPIATATTAPTATFEVVEVTVSPEPTPTTVPTAMPEPSAEPKVDLNDELVQLLTTESWSQDIPVFPTKLTTGSEPLDDDEAVAAWVEYISGTRAEFFHGGWILEFCSDGVGTWILESGSPHMLDEGFDYEIQTDPGTSWNTVVAEISMHNPDLVSPSGSANGFYVRLGLQPPDKRDADSVMMSDRPVHESPDCA